jgi:hypothetical protein
MLKSLALACVVAAVTTAPALAACDEPIPPATVNGASITDKQLSDAGQEVKFFLKQSSDYQDCLVHDLRAQQAAAKADKKTLDPSIADGVQAKIDENQKLRETVGAEYNTVVHQFCQAHPTTAGCDKVNKGP